MDAVLLVVVMLGLMLVAPLLDFRRTWRGMAWLNCE